MRTALGAAGVTCYGVLWAAGGNDVLAERFHIPLFWTTWFFRFAVFLGPVIAGYAAYRMCLGLQRRERHIIEHGVETGIIKLLPNGEYIEIERPPAPEELAPIIEERPPPAVPLTLPEVDGIQAPETRGPIHRLRIALNRRFVTDLGTPPKEHAEKREAITGGKE
jgi:ubiquinol-cytochrome c reductase cytochrome b subunit